MNYKFYDLYEKQLHKYLFGVPWDEHHRAAATEAIRQAAVRSFDADALQSFRIRIKQRFDHTGRLIDTWFDCHGKELKTISDYENLCAMLYLA